MYTALLRHQFLLVEAAILLQHCTENCMVGSVLYSIGMTPVSCSRAHHIVYCTYRQLHGLFCTLQYRHKVAEHTLYNPHRGVPEIYLCDPHSGVTEIYLWNPSVGVPEIYTKHTKRTLCNPYQGVLEIYLWNPSVGVPEIYLWNPHRGVTEIYIPMQNSLSITPAMGFQRYISVTTIVG